MPETRHIIKDNQVVEILQQYFAEKQALLDEHTSDEAAGSAEGPLNYEKLDSIWYRLCKPSNEAELVRLAFVQQREHLVRQSEDIHAQGMYVDLYRGSTSPFRLMDELIENQRAALLSLGAEATPIALTGCEKPWRDSVLRAYLHDSLRILEKGNFKSFGDAVQCHENNSYALVRAFEVLAQTHNLGSQS